MLQDAWHKAGNASLPTTLGQEFMPVTGFFDLPPYSALYIWLWRENPSGIFAGYNPAVTCPADQALVPPCAGTDARGGAGGETSLDDGRAVWAGQHSGSVGGSV